MAKDQNTTDIDVIQGSKPGLVTQINSSYLGKDQYTHARNLVRNSREGDLGTLGNEPSNLACIQAPGRIVGTVDLFDDEVMIFSGEGASSEIGIGNTKDCSYRRVLALPCLGFSGYHPVTGVAKKDFQKGVIVTFTDKHNPVRRLELNKVSRVNDCDDLLLFRKIKQPTISLHKGLVGNLPNGVYSVAIAYTVDGQVLTDWMSVTNRIQLYSLTAANALEVEITGLDSEFSQYSLVLIANYIDPNTKGATKTAKILGTYSTKQSKVHLTDLINSSYKEISLEKLVVHKNTWLKAGIISSNSKYLILGDLVTRPEEDYQLKAMSIKAEYVIEQVPLDYYSTDGADVSYYADENYDFYIQGVYNTGELTDKFHIPGREATTQDRSKVTSTDVYEYDKQFSDCDENEKIERWQVENTAGALLPQSNTFKCNRRVLGTGKLGYHESTELYPDNPAMFGKWANTPIRFHRFPDENKVPRYEVIKGKTYINIKGIRFRNIPKFDNPDIVGYKITRSDRKGGNGTVVARGLMTNMRSYEDAQLKQTVMYSNYTVNDLGADVFLSSTQTAWRKGKEQNYTPLTDYHRDKFSFYSPHTQFEPRYSLGNEIKIEAEEVATIRGSFDLVHKHPRMKLLNQFSFWLAAAVGFIESVLILAGKNNHKQTKTNVISALGVSSGTAQVFTADQTYNISSIEDLVGLDIVGFISSKIAALDAASAFTTIKNILIVIASLGIKVPFSIMSGIVEADKIFDTIYNLTGYTDYVYQYNAHAQFTQSIPQKQGQRRRRLLREAKYVPADVVSYGETLINNAFRESMVYLELNKPIADPTTKDTSRNTMSGFGVCDSREKTSSTGSAFYVTSKVANPNQYGRLGSAPGVSMHSGVLSFEEGVSTSPILYGGDCIIARMQFLKKMKFFNQDLANSDFPDGTEFDYRLYRNIAYPRFWMDTTKYQFSDLLSSTVMDYTKFLRTTTSKYNLDCKGGKDGKSITRIDNAHMYTSNNCVMDFIVECDVNINFREPGSKPFFSQQNQNLSYIFRADHLEFPEEFTVSRVYSDIYTTELYAPQQREDFDPLNPIPSVQNNSVIYSLPSFNLQQVDNWQYFLPGNYFAFRESDFGELTGIHKLDQDRIMFLFSRSSPYVSLGNDILQLDGSGRKVIIGDGGVFAQDPREVMPTDNNYGACSSRYAFSNTHLGRYYPSATQGRILQFTEGLDDITRQGMGFWCKNYMPFFLHQYFPTYPRLENPLNGPGYLSVFDSSNEVFYLCKRDFVPRKEYQKEILFDGEKFSYRGQTINLQDSRFFQDVSWTLSYSPLEKAFVSWHDWHPDWVVQTENHFLTVKGDTLYKHNERWDSFCNFYGVDYPFEIEFNASNGQTVETVRSLEYLLEVYKYKNFGRDRFHVLNQNFDRLIVHNTEQISPLLRLIHANPNPEENLKYPLRSTTDSVSFEIPFFKEENKYRVNMFWDAVKDRGEFTNSEFHLFPTDESGYRSVLNIQALNLDKPEEERKKFRHYLNHFRLTKTVSGENKFLFKLLNIKKLISQR